MRLATGSVLLLDEDDVDALATVQLGLVAAEEAARQAAAGDVVSGRVRVDGPTTWMRILAGSVPALNIMGYKEFHRVGRRLRYYVHLFEESTGEPIAIVDGRRITSLRTSATAAVAARHRVGDEPADVGVVGSGEEAWEGLRALNTALDIRSVRVFSPMEADRLRFAARARTKLRIDATAVATVAQAAHGTAVVYVADSHRTPFLTAEQVGGVGWLGLIGSTMHVHRQARGEVFLAAGQVVVDTLDALHESGDCVEAGKLGWGAGAAMLLGDYLDDEPKRDGMTLFTSMGSVEQDLILALQLVYAARIAGAGREIDPVASLSVMS